MGVRGLLTIIKEKRAYEIIDLVIVAQNNNIEILIDTHSLTRCIYEIGIKKISRDYHNEFLLLPVGEYDIMGEIYYDFHMAFKEAGIDLVWVVDGPKGVDKKGKEQKILTWQNRDEEYRQKNERIFEACNREEELKKLNDCSPIIGLESGLEQLKRAGAEIIHLLQGEADDFIAHEYKRRGSFAIMTNDSDYVLFKDCNVLFESLFTMFCENDPLKLSFVDQCNPGKIFTKPTTFQCALSNSSHVCRALGLTNNDQLIATSILRGNDFTTDHTREVSCLLGITRFSNQFPNIIPIAKYVLSHNITPRNIGKIKEIQKYIEENPSFLDSVLYSWKFYKLINISEQLQPLAQSSDALQTYLSDHIKSGEINRYCYAIHQGCYYENVCTEKLNESCASITDILEDIRFRIYPFLLQQGKTSVQEWRSRDGKFVTVNVQPTKVQTDRIKGIPEGLRKFEVIWSHRETETLKYIKQFDREKGLILYLLRYFSKINLNQNLKISEKEFKALFATVFYQYASSKDVKFSIVLDRTSFLRMRICPTARCLTIATWFMNLYYTAKYICGCALKISKWFPTPVKIMNGSTLFAFYAAIVGDGSRVHKLSGEMKTILLNTEMEIFEIFSNEYQVVTKN